MDSGREASVGGCGRAYEGLQMAAIAVRCVLVVVKTVIETRLPMKWS